MDVWTVGIVVEPPHRRVEYVLSHPTHVGIEVLAQVPFNATPSES